MEILANEDEWTSVDEQRLAEFLNTATGRRFIPTLVRNIPQLLAGGETNAIMIRAGEVRAFSTMVEAILLLAHPPAELPRFNSDAYPPLEDDTKWDDGNKLTPPSTTDAVPPKPQ